MSDNSNFPAEQESVHDHYTSNGYTAGTVGEYVRVQLPKGGVTCFGPTNELGISDRLGWVVVEIDWDNNSMLMAPVTALYDVTPKVDTPEDWLDRDHHNAPKDSNGDPKFSEPDTVGMSIPTSAIRVTDSEGQKHTVSQTEIKSVNDDGTVNLPEDHKCESCHDAVIDE